MIRRHDVALVVMLSIVALGAGCNDNPVGRICDLGTQTPGDQETVVASPSLDCVSRTCLREVPTRALPPGGVLPPANSGLCTAECSTDDECDRVPESPCVTGFTCGVAVTAGPFCCKKFCICKDYIDPAQNDVMTGVACDASKSDNDCCNLPGRDNNAMYPLCHS
jgi:hypothetical protein